ncbi:MAG: hypothetical protein ACREJG_01630, partial [Candidatus Rokuibacteriota bacterium]
MNPGGAPDLDRQLRQLETLIREMEEGPESPARARARQIVRAVLDLHASGLTRMMELVAAGPHAPQALVELFARDPRVSGMLLLHGLHPFDLETRVGGAVHGLEPALRAQGAGLTLVSVSEGSVRLRLAR